MKQRLMFIDDFHKKKVMILKCVTLLFIVSFFSEGPTPKDANQFPTQRKFYCSTISIVNKCVFWNEM